MKMAVMSKHERESAPEKSSAKVAAWSVLITMGGTSVTLNIWDATHAAHLFWLLAVLKGLAPVLAAMLLSEAGARYDGGKPFRCVAFGIMAGAMVLSASAVATVLRPSYPPGVLGVVMSWLFGIVLDAAALTGLWVILTERESRRDAARQAQAASAEDAVAAAVAETETRVREESAAAVAELTSRVAELQDQISALKRRLSSGRKRAAASPRNFRASSPLNNDTSSPPNIDDASPPEAADLEDVDTHAEALAILAAEPGISGSKLGLRLGKTERYGCMLKNKLAPPAGSAGRAVERHGVNTDPESGVA
jgi:hypothetical protein